MMKVRRKEQLESIYYEYMIINGTLKKFQEVDGRGEDRRVEGMIEVIIAKREIRKIAYWTRPSRESKGT
jgi:hypothetical protein